jgi:hypothetical protein
MTLAGYILIPVGLLAFVFSRRWLYRMLVFSLPFSATAVFNAGSGENTSGVQVWVFLGGLWLLRGVGSRLMRGNVAINRHILAACSYLILFLAVASISLVMPLYIDGSLAIRSPLLMDDSTTPLFLSSRHLYALLYLILGGLVCLSIANENLSPDKAAESERIFLASGLFVAVWGIFQYFCYTFHITYPAMVFNNSSSPGAQGYAAIMEELGMARVSSVAVEPSILAQTLLSVAPLTLPALFNRGFVFSIRADRICFAFLVITLLASASSVAYAGLVCFLAGAAALSAWMRGSSRRAVIGAVLGSGILILGIGTIAYLFLSPVRTLIDIVLINKRESFSALERLRTISNASDYFRQYPILGVGWGSVTSHDLVFKLLANVGILGLASFFMLGGAIGRRIYRQLDAKIADRSLSQIVWLLSFILLMFTNLISEFAYVFGYFWFVLGMAIAASATKQVAENKTLARLHRPRPEGTV